MQAAARPLDESRRIEVLNSSGLLDTPAEERFDRIVRLAQKVSGCRIATLGLIDSRREWFKASAGWEPPQIARDMSFSSHVVATAEELFVGDARADSRFADHPLVIGEPWIRCYAGFPITVADGSILGALAVLDLQPRRPAQIDSDALRDLAAIAADEVGVNRLSPSQIELAARSGAAQESGRIDPLTRLWNRSAMLEILAREVAHAVGASAPLAALIVDVDKLREVNDRSGHDAGDEVLRGVARVMRASLRPYDSIARTGGEEFVALLPGATQDATLAAADRIRLAVRREVQASGATVTVTIGAAGAPPWRGNGESLMRAAEQALARAKNLGSDSFALARDS